MRVLPIRPPWTSREMDRIRPRLHGREARNLFADQCRQCRFRTIGRRLSPSRPGRIRSTSRLVVLSSAEPVAPHASVGADKLVAFPRRYLPTASAAISGMRCAELISAAATRTAATAAHLVGSPFGIRTKGANCSRSVVAYSAAFVRHPETPVGKHERDARGTVESIWSTDSE